jgi:MFS family permease
MTMARTHAETFYGWRVVGGAFVLAVFGWGMGFFGPPVFLSVIRETRGWPVPLISTAVTLHFLIGAVTGAKLPALYRRFGPPMVTKAGALFMASGVFAWSTAAEPWQLFGAGALTGIGWSAMSAAAINALISPWFARKRPAALAMAYNGGSIGGVVFSPLWVAAIFALGFPAAALATGLVMAITLWVLASTVFARTPEQMGLRADGDADDTPPASATWPAAEPLPGSLLWRDARFRTLAAGMALGLFAQIGLVAHLFSLLVPALGAQRAGLAMGLVTVLAIVGRTSMAWPIARGCDRRLLACAGYALQLAGSIAFLLAGGTSVPLLMAGVVLFGAGFGNATSLPPLIAQLEFVPGDVVRVVSLIVGISQGGYAFAPAVFGLIREFAPHADAAGAAPGVFAAAALVQGFAIAAFLLGRRRRRAGG